MPNNEGPTGLGLSRLLAHNRDSELVTEGYVVRRRLAYIRTVRAKGSEISPLIKGVWGSERERGEPIRRMQARIPSGDTGSEQTRKGEIGPPRRARSV